MPNVTPDADAECLMLQASRACFDAGGLSAERMVYTETRKALPPDALTAFKAAIAILSPAAKGDEEALALASAAQVAMTWEQLKAKGKAGGVPWGQVTLTLTLALTLALALTLGGRAVGPGALRP